jgi:hypothetical protein
MPGALLVPAGLGGVAARLEVILEEMLEVKGLPTGRMPSTSCNENEERQWDACWQRPLQRIEQAPPKSWLATPGPGRLHSPRCVERLEMEQ